MAKKTSGKPQEMTQNSPGAAPVETGNRENGTLTGNGRTEQTQGGSNGSREMMLSNEEIAERAYQIYEREGRSDGRAMDHWLQAESELRAERQTRGSSTNTPQSRQDQPRSARQFQASTSGGV